MSKEKETLVIPEKLEGQMEYVEIAKQLVAQKKAEFEALQGKITQYKTQVASLEQRLITLESEHKQKLTLEKQSFEREKNAKLNELANRDEALRKGERDLVERKMLIEEREARVEGLKEEKKALFEEKVRYEQLNNQAQIKFNEANNLYGEAIKKIDEASKKEDEVKINLLEIKNIQSINEKAKEDLIIKANDIKKQIDNLVALRKEVEPRIEELNKVIAENEKKLKEITQKEQEVKDRLEEDNKLLLALDERDKTLKTKELDIATREEELLRKELIFKTK